MCLGTHTFQRIGDGSIEINHILWYEVRQVAVLAMIPDHFCRVEIGHIRRQPFYLKPVRVFSLPLVETHLERESPPRPLWLAYQPPSHQQPEEQSVVRLWRSYEHRWPVEPGTRFRKQSLAWTLPRFQDAEACDRWTLLVTLAQWQLFLARGLIAERPLPWQRAQENPTPERVLQGLGGLFSQIPTPAREPQVAWLAKRASPDAERAPESGQKDHQEGQEEALSELFTVRNSIVNVLNWHRIVSSVSPFI